MLFPQLSDRLIYEVSTSLEGVIMYIDHVGKKFGKWLVKEFFKIGNVNHYLVECECGTQSKPRAYHVVNGYTSSCKFCAPKKHGHYNTPTNRSWNGARNRCFNPNNKDYIHYGARGITMCERWSKFENFLADMGEKPKGMSLDRIDNNGNYEPGNCRWATYSQQNSNQRRRRMS